MGRQPASRRAAIVAALEGVIDPCCRERGISVVDMGLVRDIEVAADGAVHIEILLTSGWCPFQVDLVDEIGAAVEQLPDVDAAAVSITLEEAWSTERLSDEARRKLQFLPEPGEVDDPAGYAAATAATAPTASATREEQP